MDLISKKEFCNSFCQHPTCWQNLLQYPEYIQYPELKPAENNFLPLEIQKIQKIYGNSGKNLWPFY
jgi:hypothetical protein